MCDEEKMLRTLKPTNKFPPSIKQDRRYFFDITVTLKQLKTFCIGITLCGVPKSHINHGKIIITNCLEWLIAHKSAATAIL